MTPQSAVEVTKTFTVIDDGNSDITVGDIVRFNTVSYTHLTLPTNREV